MVSNSNEHQQSPPQFNVMSSPASSTASWDPPITPEEYKDDTIDVETLGNENKKHKRKASSNPRKPKAECWKYFDQKFEKDEDGVIIKMAYCKWCPTVFKADSHRHENGCVPMEQNGEDSNETPFDFLTNDELCKKFVEKVEKDMGVLFAIYKEKYGTTTSSDLSRSMSSKSSSSRNRRGNAFLNSFKDTVRNKSSGGEDELKKYLKEPRLELEDDEDFDILNWWKLNSLRFPIVSRMAKDILCIQVSTVTSESTFSARRRVLDLYRNSLAPNIVEALVCTQDWIRTSSRNIIMDTFEEDDELAKEIQEGLDKQLGEQGKEKNVEA